MYISYCLFQRYIIMSSEYSEIQHVSEDQLVPVMPRRLSDVEVHHQKIAVIAGSIQISSDQIQISSGQIQIRSDLRQI